MFLFFVGGVTREVRQVLKQEAGRCINCRSPADLVDTNNVLKLFFVPVWRWPGKDQLMHCNNCGLFYPPSLSPISSDFRPSESLRCQFCAREVDSDFRFCPFCGSAL
ncbi:uncharacterized protein LOC111899287 [Lactuca sativa]|uniref:uncharacterized protein LOC111899287 n=1 Tax=Lactuca sativa TaxID=4236 RepID=UPI000CD8EC57|nr:uncharacterized protein LOC111899287 [Lactuca sativa]